MTTCPICEQSETRNPDHDDTCNECRKEISILIRVEEIQNLLDMRD